MNQQKCARGAFGSDFKAQMVKLYQQGNRSVNWPRNMV
jgi:hypothetical protein